MKIRLLSDLHNEFSIFVVPIMEDEHEQILIIAGDIGVAQNGQRENTLIEFFESMCKRFYKVVFVAGNHEFYNSDISEVHPKLYDETDHLDNFIILNDSMAEIDDVIFVGGTLWTDLKGGDTLIMNEAKRCMNDYFTIKHNKAGYRRLEPSDTTRFHERTRDYIFHIASENRDKQVVVVSHHAPSYGSVAIQYRSSSFDNIMNYNFFSDLDDLIEMNDNIVLYTHGHTHTSFDYNIGKTRVICNPRGYSKYQDKQENALFNPKLVIEI